MMFECGSPGPDSERALQNLAHPPLEAAPDFSAKASSDLRLYSAAC